MGLRASLLVRSPETGELYVNYDPEIRTQIRETDCMMRMGLEIPPLASILQLKKDVFKKNYDKLQVFLCPIAFSQGQTGHLAYLAYTRWIANVWGQNGRFGCSDGRILKVNACMANVKDMVQCVIPPHCTTCTINTTPPVDKTYLQHTSPPLTKILEGRCGPKLPGPISLPSPAQNVEYSFYIFLLKTVI